MKELSRRQFIIRNGIALAGAPLLMSAKGERISADSQGLRIQFTRDGLDLNPYEYSNLLTELTKNEDLTDNYSRFGVVEKLENKFSEMLGTESSVFMPTGTLANNIALRKLAGEKRRVLVQATSHIYNDSGDCTQTLSNLTLIPLAPGKTSFTLDEVKRSVETTNNGRTKTEIGVISIESPVRRMNNEMFDYREMVKISTYARSNGIKLHLDGARLFNAVAHSGISVREFAALFDTIYISLYKDFNSASGAILCGTKEFTDDLYHTRRMFGGGLPQVWPFAAVALHYADGFLDEYGEAVKRFAQLKEKLNATNRFVIEEIEGGSNVFRMEVKCRDISKYRSALWQSGIELPEALSGNLIFPKINNTLLRMDAASLAEIFIRELN